MEKAKIRPHRLSPRQLNPLQLIFIKISMRDWLPVDMQNFVAIGSGVSAP